MKFFNYWCDDCIDFWGDGRVNCPQKRSCPSCGQTRLKKEPYTITVYYDCLKNEILELDSSYQCAGDGELVIDWDFFGSDPRAGASFLEVEIPVKIVKNRLRNGSIIRLGSL